MLGLPQRKKRKGGKRKKRKRGSVSLLPHVAIVCMSFSDLNIKEKRGGTRAETFYLRVGEEGGGRGGRRKKKKETASPGYLRRPPTSSRSRGEEGEHPPFSLARQINKGKKKERSTFVEPSAPEHAITFKKCLQERKKKHLVFFPSALLRTRRAKAEGREEEKKRGRGGDASSGFCSIRDSAKGGKGQPLSSSR